LKRAFDVVLSGVGLLFSFPLWAVIATAIKLNDGGAVFYPQARVGMGGTRFRSWKFRSMTEGSDAGVGPLQARERDPRVTRVGRLLRATAMDELPQLWNIFKGDMSFVGPRPERPELVSEYRRTVPGYDARFTVAPGLTGIAQVYGSYDSTPRIKLRYDLLYIDRRSLWLDARLVALSFWVTFRGKWEHRGAKF
jgi:lipopolysaccharide/colanic/teichoic acid biosynthesis glycosyltransferase